MSHDASPAGTETSLAEWNKLLRPYSAPDTGRSIAQLLVTLGLLAAGFAAMIAADLYVSYWLALALALPTGLLLVRVFIIQHDCGHYSFLSSRKACDWLGRALGVLTLTPYTWWKRDHDWHHSSSGDLSRRGYGDIDTLTVAEYKALPAMGKLGYRLYRSPLVLFGIGPLWQFLVRHRLPVNLRKDDRQSAVSILTTNVAVAVMLALGCWSLGFVTFLALWLPVLAVAATAGVWMFFVQHQFETTHWAQAEKWSFVAAALKGCSYYKLPRPLEWVTGYIGYHHIHHLAARVPNYRLRQCFEEVPALAQATTITFLESLKCSRLALWCEDRQRLLSFREALA